MIDRYDSFCHNIVNSLLHASNIRYYGSYIWSWYQNQDKLNMPIYIWMN